MLKVKYKNIKGVETLKFPRSSYTTFLEKLAIIA